MSNSPASDPIATLPVLLTPKQVSEIIGFTEDTLTTYRCRGSLDLPFVRIGRSIRYRLSDVQALIDRGLRQHTADPGREADPTDDNRAA